MTVLGGELPEAARAVAFLHDVLERSASGDAELLARGLTELEAGALDLLTRTKDEPYELYVLRIAAALWMAALGALFWAHRHAPAFSWGESPSRHLGFDYILMLGVPLPNDMVVNGNHLRRYIIHRPADDTTFLRALEKSLTAGKVEGAIARGDSAVQARRTGGDLSGARRLREGQIELLRRTGVADTLVAAADYNLGKICYDQRDYAAAEAAWRHPL